MDTTQLNSVLALMGYTTLGSCAGVLAYQLNPTQLNGNSLIMGALGSASGFGLGLILENSRPLKVIEEKDKDNVKITKFSIGGSVLEFTKDSLTPVAIVVASFVLSSAISKK